MGWPAAKQGKSPAMAGDEASQSGSAKPGLSLKGRALKYLAAREHSRLELQRKLAPHAASPEAVDRVLDELESRGFLSAERFVQSVLHRKASRYGAARVQAELAQHRLPAELTDVARQQLRDTELPRAHAVWARRFGQAPCSPEDRLRQTRFLAGRGFSGDVIRAVLKAAAEGAPSPDLDASEAADADDLP